MSRSLIVQPRPPRRRGAGRRLLRGLTVIELLVVLVVVGVVVTLVAPSMRGTIARKRVEGVQAELITDLQLARSEGLQRSGSSTSVGVTFGGNADITCYLIHTAPTGVACDCTRPPGAACLPAGAASEIKSMQFARAAGVTMAASSASGNRVVFSPPQGLATPGDLVIDVQDPASGQLRTSVSGLGVLTVCSPDGSMRGVPSC
jgi:prepilin-type N-terminal cleavage/methylation domain-containing protein